MKNIYVLWKNNLSNMLFKSVFKFIGIILVPVLIAVIAIKIFAGGSTPKIGVGIVDNSKTEVSEYVIDSLEKVENIYYTKVDEDKLQEKFAASDITSAVIFNKDFEELIINGDISGVETISKEGDQIVDILSTVIESELKNLTDLALVTNDNREEFYNLLNKYEGETTKIDLEVVSNKLSGYEAVQVSFGFLFMLMLVRGIFGAVQINKEKNNGVYSRVLVSGTTTLEYYLANMLASFTGLLLQSIFTLLILKFIVRINLGFSILEGMVILGLVSILAVAIGTLTCILTQNEKVAGILANIIIVPLLMISGAFVPLEFFNETLNTISKLTPVRWIVDIMHELQGGGSILNQLGNIVLVLLFSTAIMVIVGFVTKSKNKAFKGA